MAGYFGWITPNGEHHERPWSGDYDFDDETHDTLAHDIGYTNLNNEHGSCIHHALKMGAVRYIRSNGGMEIETNASPNSKLLAANFIKKHHRDGANIHVTVDRNSRLFQSTNIAIKHLLGGDSHSRLRPPGADWGGSESKNADDIITSYLIDCYDARY